MVLIELLTGLVAVSLLVLFAWLADLDKKAEKKYQEEVSPLLGVVLPNKKDKDTNE